jgi:phosphate starvation-inducible protein PhoH
MEKVIELKTLEPIALLGVADTHIKLIEAAIPATIIARGKRSRFGEKILMLNISIKFFMK